MKGQKYLVSESELVISVAQYGILCGRMRSTPDCVANAGIDHVSIRYSAF